MPHDQIFLILTSKCPLKLRMTVSNDFGLRNDFAILLLNAVISIKTQYPFKYSVIYFSFKHIIKHRPKLLSKFKYSNIQKMNTKVSLHTTIYPPCAKQIPALHNTHTFMELPNDIGK